MPIPTTECLGVWLSRIWDVSGGKGEKWSYRDSPVTFFDADCFFFSRISSKYQHMYQLALKLEASLLVATQATNAVQCFGKGSKHGQWSSAKSNHVKRHRCSFHCMHFHSPQGLLAWRPTLQICRHDLPRLGASPLEGLERLKLKEFWIIINKWSILSNYQQIFWIILIVDDEYIKRYKH